MQEPIKFECIESERLSLKGLSPDAMNSIFEHYPPSEIKLILGIRSDADFLKEEAKYKNGYACYNRSFKLFLLIEKASGQIIGRCGIHNWNNDHRRAEIGYVMENENLRGQGLMSEAVQKVLHFGFHSLHLNRIEAIVGSFNVPSLKLLKKFNFTQEGVLRRHYLTQNGYEDSILFSLLRDEFVSGVK